MTQPPMLAADHIKQLTHPYTTTEIVTQPTPSPDGKWRTTTRPHTVHHPPLLEQLKGALYGIPNIDDAFVKTGSYQSRPGARLDAIATYERIDQESLEFATQLGIPPLRIRDRLLAISGAIGDKPNRKVKSWWVAARTTTQWETRPYQPTNAPCPNETCEQYGTLKIRLTEHLAHCTHCGTTWEGETEVQNIGRWIRWATDHELKNGVHWTLNEDSQLTECLECQPTRDAMTQRATTRQTEQRIGA